MKAWQDLPHICPKCDKKIKKNEHYMYLERKKGHKYVHVDCEY